MLLQVFKEKNKKLCETEHSCWMYGDNHEAFLPTEQKWLFFKSFIAGGGNIRTLALAFFSGFFFRFSSSLPIYCIWRYQSQISNHLYFRNINIDFISTITSPKLQGKTLYGTLLFMWLKDRYQAIMSNYFFPMWNKTDRNKTGLIDKYPPLMLSFQRNLSRRKNRILHILSSFRSKIEFSQQFMQILYNCWLQP